MQGRDMEAKSSGDSQQRYDSCKGQMAGQQYEEDTSIF